MDKKDNNDKEAYRVFGWITIIFLLFVFILIRGCVGCSTAVIQEASSNPGARTGLLVFGGLVLFIILVMNADRKN